MMLFSSGIAAEQFAVLAALGLVSVLTLIYVVRAFRRIWWQPPAEGTVAKPAGDRLLAPALLIVAVLLLGLWPEPLVRLAEATAAWMSDPQAYIQAVLGG
jgi:formate hydrogenlyase subunit 3/multisubunit Na+/H+ antiporter MnhD subunit